MSSNEDRAIGIEEARKHLGSIANRAHLAGEITYLTRNGTPIAAVVPLDRIKETVMAATHTLTIVDGEQSGANGEEFGVAGINVSDEVYAWFAENDVDLTDEPDRWVLVTPVDEYPGELINVVAQRDVTATT